IISSHPTSPLFPSPTLFRSAPQLAARSTLDCYHRQPLESGEHLQAISPLASAHANLRAFAAAPVRARRRCKRAYCLKMLATFERSEEHTSELQSRGQLVCRL